MTPFSLFFLPSWVLIILSCIPFSHGFLPIHQQLNFRILALNENELDDNSSDDKDLIILCVGDALLDCIATNEARGWSVDEITTKNAWTAFPGGAPANVATALVKLGTPSALCACLGMDDDGDLLQSILTNTGVNTLLVQRTDKLPTRRVMVTRSIEGDREFGGFYDNRAADEFADSLLDAASIQAEELLLQRCQWIVCSTLSLAFPKSREAITQLVEHALQQNVKLLVDVNWRPVFWQPQHTESHARDTILQLVQKAHVVKLTDEEAEWLFGIPDALENPTRVHDELSNAQAVLVTAGEKGASYSLFGCTGRVEAFHVPVVETTGAGDAFTAGFLHALCTIPNRDNEEMDKLSQEEKAEAANDVIRFASAVGALTCTKEGAIAAQPTLDQVESFLIHGEKVWS